jgi:ferritin-like metal-binding protein YciE
MAMQSAQDLFLHELSDVYDAERRIVQMLPQMANECSITEVKTAFQQHEQETQQQIRNLEQCFQILGTKPASVPCQAIAGLKQEHDTFVKEKPADTILVLFDLGGAAKTEHYEIAAYRGLVDQATLLGQKECVRLLQENLTQEEAMAKKVEQIGHKVGQQLIQQSGQQQKQKV